MSTLFSAMKPVLLTRFIGEAGLSETLAGLIVAMPFVGIAASSWVNKVLFRHLGLSQLSIVFSALLVIAELISAYYFSSLLLLLVAQLLGGISVGVLMGSTSRMIARSDQPNHIFGFVDMMAVFFMSFMVAGVGFAVGKYGLKGGYLFAAGLATLFGGFMVFFHRGTPSTTKEQVLAVELLNTFIISYRPIIVVFLGLFFVTCSGLGFAFMFTVALNLGMEYASAGSFIGGLLLVSALACQFGGWCSARYGMTLPLAAAFVTCGLGWWVAINASNQVMFMVGLIPAIFSLQFNFPILLSLSASLDEDGQWASIAAPLQTSGFAWAAISAGVIVDYWGIPALATSTAVGMLICVL